MAGKALKVRDSGMPEEQYWENLFDVSLILDRMRVDRTVETLVEFGCGYGTFTIPAARHIHGRVITLDIDAVMIETARQRATDERVDNIDFVLRDFITDGTDLADETADYVMLFNILHHEKPAEILAETNRILKPGGIAGIIHWNYDPNTPRGPKMEIRPKPEDLRSNANAAGFRLLSEIPIDLPPWHFGWLAQK